MQRKHCFRFDFEFLKTGRELNHDKLAYDKMKPWKYSLVVYLDYGAYLCQSAKGVSQKKKQKRN